MRILNLTWDWWFLAFVIIPMLGFVAYQGVMLIVESVQSSRRRMEDSGG